MGEEVDRLGEERRYEQAVASVLDCLLDEVIRELFCQIHATHSLLPQCVKCPD